MDSGARTRPLVVVVGETASGKSALALEIAKKFDGEIICADSRTVYKGLDIGTAKPTPEERALVPHYLVDVVTPDQPFTVADFKHLANQAIDDIRRRGALPILVGGTGLYIDAVIFNYEFSPPAEPAIRRRLEKLSVSQLQTEIKRRGLALPTNAKNPRHLIRTLETGGVSQKRHQLRPNTIVVGLSVQRDDLRQRIADRVDQMVQGGFVKEVQRLANQYGWEVPALQAPGYKAFKPYLEGKISLDQAKNAFIKNDLDLAKRQRTWFKRNKSIQWIQSPREAVAIVTTQLNK